MALPTTLSTLDIGYRGLPHCFVPTKTSTDTTTLDYAYRGLPFVTNPEVVAPPDQNAGTLDEVYQGLPFAHLNADRTLDLVYQGLPFSGGTEDRNRTFVVGVTVNVTAPTATINGLLRKFPLVRNEFVSSENEGAHVFPYITIQDPALLP